MSSIPTLARNENPPLSRKERKRAKIRDSLVGAATQLLSSRSPDSVNVDEIVELADVSKGTFYNYFTDKGAIIREVKETARSQLEKLVVEYNAGVEDAAERVARGFAAALRFVLSAPNETRTLLLMDPHATDPDLPMNKGIRRDVRLGMKQHRFSKTISEEAGVVLALGIMQAGTSRALDLQSVEPIRELGEALCAALLIGLGVSRTEAQKIATAVMKDLPEAPEQAVRS